MPVYEEHRWIASCDECEWTGEPCDWYDQAETLLDNHLIDKH